MALYAPLRSYYSFICALCVALLLAAAVPARAALPVAQGESLPTLAPMLEKTAPAVVNIAIETRVRTARNPLLEDPFFRRFFNIPEQQQPSTRRAISAGSGVIVDAKQGYVLTNAHVAKNADKIEVTLTDGRELSAELVGLDEEVDLAVLKLDKTDDLTQIRIGDSTGLRVGDYVLAIGNPFGLGQTVTSGIVSALGRTGLGIEGYENFIQTDASINPGNSGGALVNLRGELVGINTAILAPSGGNVGIGFAIPTEMAVNVMEQLIEHGEVRRGVLGVTIQDLTPELADAFQVKQRQRGVVVTNVVEDSAADKAGLKAGDVVVEVDGQAVTRAADLRNKVGLSPVGEKVRLNIIRDGRKREVVAVITESDQRQSGGDAISKFLQGASLRDLRKGELRHADSGVLVEAVERNSPAWRAGLRGGDVIINANRQNVANMKELESAVPDADAALLLRVNRDGGVFFVVVR
ncbi:DegQ family serine endoprotease [Alloalcanivorax xenomutans]|uniref:DegQ family serine endoprotease n=1 Tax=Alloalcanivorax xenomutans TaxID=1094342 RepID=UPI0004B11ACF|nr:DegQ family serine endoprotease [Alloalcanivorax xenomutans]KYZ87244.1 serine endoprotease DegQ [Alcanivorax sp. KX64203]MBA4723166.1 DegQ family serine endoprotease [Alcanivorax sp.]MCE7522476.1 DegQ family serine endoprotease [Alloalcanivorax xenomutans]PHS56877.1 MAG: serine endoprotease DegQ [Alcanivorax sp.]WOA32807.1 DegQ family serine endoprotease [Alloalcanivorax xenomutans]